MGQLRFQVLTATSLDMTVFWDAGPCLLAETGWRFKEYRHLQLARCSLQLGLHMISVLGIFETDYYDDDVTGFRLQVWKKFLPPSCQTLLTTMFPCTGLLIQQLGTSLLVIVFVSSFPSSFLRSPSRLWSASSKRNFSCSSVNFQYSNSYKPSHTSFYSLHNLNSFRVQLFLISDVAEIRILLTGYYSSLHGV